MKCEKCHVNEATVFMTQKINGESLEMNLCESCAAEQEGPMLDEAFSFQQFLSGFMDSPQAKVEAKVCPHCGMSLKDFKQSSKVGCAQCYATFAQDMHPIVRRLHGTAKHNGKVPGRIGAGAMHQKRLEDYESRLKIALMKEDYESAAYFRDKIRDLKGRDDL